MRPAPPMPAYAWAIRRAFCLIPYSFPPTDACSGSTLGRLRTTRSPNGPARNAGLSNNRLNSGQLRRTGHHRLLPADCASLDAPLTMAQILVLHGPNLNLLGTREPEVYGRTTLAVIDASLRTRADDAGHALATFQSNDEAA